MELQFESNLEYQQEAIKSVVDIFRGQEICNGVFTIRRTSEEKFLNKDVNGVSNRLQLLDDAIAKNVRDIQLRNGLAMSSLEDVGTHNFSVQMETGTGKTYVYLRSIFELNKQYAFTKFIIVVPSIAIKEGVAKSIELMTKHLQAQYNKVPFYAFVYNSKRLECVRNFAISNNIQIMIINIDAFRRNVNIFCKYNDRMLGRPEDFVKQCNPIVIIDEPQSVDNTPKARDALKLLNPLCQLRYSATHRSGQYYCMMYKLDSVDAYNKRLVKQIEVASLRVADDHNSAYVRLLSAKNKRGQITAELELDVLENMETRRKTVSVQAGCNLQDLTRRQIYANHIVDNICCERGTEYIRFSNGKEVRLGGAIGDADEDAIKRQLIKHTIEEHLEKELALRGRGIKVLSLFFIDRVENYRKYNADGTIQNGKYAQWFEEIYAEKIRLPKYSTLFNDVDTQTLSKNVHDGYFSIDKKTGQMRDTSEGDNNERDAAERGYELIMRNKTLLLSFDSPVKFIFSHSALKEGWDNPNVFQICTLNEITSDMRRRQMIGRGLRICVNQNGERVRGDNINTLTVMANESFASFSENLQKEIEEEDGIRFNVVESSSFANMVVINEDGTSGYLGTERSAIVVRALKDKGYITQNGRVTDNLKNALIGGALSLPAEFEVYRKNIEEVLTRICGSLNIKNRDCRKRLTLNKERFISPEFQELWNKIKYKTVYRVDFDTKILVNSCANAIKEAPDVPPATYIYGKGRAEVTAAGVEVMGQDEQVSVYNYSTLSYPDIVSYLQNETNLTRKTIVEILRKSERLDDFKKNPQMFIDGAVRIIRKVMAETLVDGIKYHKLGDTNIWAQELFESEELFGYLNEQDATQTNIEPTPNKGLYDYAIYDSPNIERNFAKKLDCLQDVKLFAKLPNWFKIPTPLGSYNPDWAVVVERDGVRKLYFVVETKGTNFLNELRPEESAKIQCGKKHFEALGASETSYFDYLAPIKDFQDFEIKVVDIRERTK